MQRVYFVAWGLVSLVLTATPSPCPLPQGGEGLNKPKPVYLWLEPEWFKGVEGRFAYWTGTAKPTGKWGVAGPGISAEWTQGGESEWNSIGVPAEETKAECAGKVHSPRSGKHRIWVRYVDHRGKTEPFRLRLLHDDGSTDDRGAARPTKVLSAAFGVEPLVPVNDEYQLYWGFSFGWAFVDVELPKGDLRVELRIEKAGEAWRQIDAILITDDFAYTPVGREKPPFAYLESFKLHAKDGKSWRGQWAPAADTGGSPWKRPLVAGKDFTMWTGVDADPKWWSRQKLDSLSLYDVLFQFSPPQDIREKFHKQFDGKKDMPLLTFPHYVPGVYLGSTPDLSPGTPLRQWLERTRTPFYILTNYANPTYDEKTGPATFQALTGALAEQFQGYIHGEAIGSPGLSLPDKALGKTRREHVDALATHLLKQQADAWSKVYKTAAPETHWAKGISCLSVNSIALAHLFHEMGSKVVGYEIDATNVHAPMRIAFERGAARQYGGAWINYASGNFGDACNYFSQNPVVNRGAGSWFHSKYAVTDGVSIGWYRKLYYLNYLGGASAIFWEQSLANQWILPGPGEHSIGLSPFGRATEEFQAFVQRLPDRGEPFTPIAILLGYGHGYERVNYHCKMLDVFGESNADMELRELFNVCWHPTAILEGRPAAPDVQSLPGGIYGNLFDVLVDRHQKAQAIFNYPVVIAAGDVHIDDQWTPILEQYVRQGGTLVVNAVAAGRSRLPDALLGLSFKLDTRRLDSWMPEPGTTRPCVAYNVYPVQLAGATPLIWAAENLPLVTRHAIGKGAVIVTLTPHMLGWDGRAHPAWPMLMNALTAELTPIGVRIHNPNAATGAYVQVKGELRHLPLSPETDPTGEILYQFNKTKDGWLVLLMNNRGVDKTQHGVARVDRTAFVDVVLRTKLPVKSAKEYTQPRDLAVQAQSGERVVRLRVHPGDVQVVGLIIP